jgi:predicted metal-dependent peptidase
MRNPYTPAHLAAGAVKSGILRLADTHPFHARILEQFRLVASPPVRTVGVTATRSEVLLLYNPDFVLRLPPDQLAGVLLHEVHHVLFSHIFINPADYPDRWALMVALEVTANEFIREPLPPGGILLEQFPTLPAMESSDERYRRLETVHDRFSLEGLSLAPAGASGGGGDSADTFDNHGIWGEALKDPQAARQALADLVQQAAVDAGGMPRELREALTRAAGTSPGHAVQVLQGDHHGRLDWRQLLRHHVARILEPRPVFYRPPRRAPHLLGILHGRRRRNSRETVAAIIDTSGSVRDECLEDIDGELRRISRFHPVQIILSDCQVHKVFRYRDRLEHVTGRGGTDFRPALERSVLDPLKPGVIVYFTDGFGQAPEKPPVYPMIWCLVPGGKPPAPWGRVVAMDH